MNRENVALINIEINGWPYIFVISTKNIPKHTELFSFYGKDFYQSIDKLNIIKNTKQLAAQMWRKQLS